VPETAQGSTGKLAAELAYRSGGSSRRIDGDASVTVKPLATATAADAVVVPGGSGTATLRLGDTLSRPVTVRYTVAPPAGVTASPAGGTVVVPPGGVTTSIALSASSDAKPGDDQAVVSLTATDAGRVYPLPSADLPVVVPYPSLSAAFDNVGITDDADHTPGDFDGSGNSYSAQTLAAAGIVPGGTVTSGGLDFTWPDVASGANDNIGAQGQPVALHGSGSSLGFVYTDGTTAPFTLAFSDWFSAAPASGGQLVATLPYLNRTNGKPLNPVSLFEDSVPIDPNKTLAAVILPTAAAATSLHVFALTP
jgi:hypothetical protein